MSLRDFTIYDLICRNAQINPERVCIMHRDRRITYWEYREHCERIASGLVELGIKRGDRLGVVSRNCSEFMIIYGAAAKLGVIVVPVNWRFQSDEIQHVLSECRPRLLFAGDGYTQVVGEIAKNMATVEACVYIGAGDVPEGFISFSMLYAKEKLIETFDVSADCGLAIIHTAAVAGRPRGAVLSQGNIIASNMITMLQFTLNHDDCHLCFLPLFHVAGLSLFMAVMHAGGKNVLMDHFDAETSLQLIERERGTIFYQFPPVLKMLTEKHNEHHYDISSLRHVGGIDHPDTISHFLEIAPNVRFWTGYGQTEAMGVSYGAITERPGSTGKPSPLVRVEIFDENDRRVPVDHEGEICIRSPSVFLGYWEKEEESAYTSRNGWHHTGDIGRFDDGGYLWYVKRKAEKELIKPGGENVYPAEVENAILKHDAVAEVSVIGVPDSLWGEAVKAVCVLKPGIKLDPEELIEFVGLQIARYKKPKEVVYVDSLPKTASGEIDRDRLKAEHGLRSIINGNATSQKS